MGAERTPSVDELAAIVEARAGGGDPAARLRAAVELGRVLTETGDALVERFVSEARSAGVSWTEVGATFGTSKQAAQKRYAGGASDAGAWPGRWAPAARHVLDIAGEQARVLGHDYVGTEHALLGLLEAREGLAAHVLADLGVSSDDVLARLPGPCVPRDYDCLGVMPRFKRALEQAGRIAGGLGHRVANTEHLLAGIVTIPDALATEILADLGISADAVRETLAARLDVARERLASPPRRRRRLLSRAA
jgi:ATP-dependent Clp protease ATP-binding subunit ClpA